LAATADGRTGVLTAQSAEAPLELRAALVPEPTRVTERVLVQRLDPAAALKELLHHPRLTRWRSSEPIARLFELTADVAETLPVYRAKVPWGPPFRAGLVEELLANVGIDAVAVGDRMERGGTCGIERMEST